MFLRRIGPDPHANGQQTPQLVGCPDILELDNGDSAIIGADITPSPPEPAFFPPQAAARTSGSSASPAGFRWMPSPVSPATRDGTHPAVVTWRDGVTPTLGFRTRL